MLFFKLITITLRAPFFHRLPSSGLKSWKLKWFWPLSKSHFFLDPYIVMKFNLFYPCLDVFETISHTTRIIINLGFFWILCIKNNLKEYSLWISRIKFEQSEVRQKINNQCFVATCTSALLRFAGFWPPPSQPVSFTSLINSWGLELKRCFSWLQMWQNISSSVSFIE